MEADLDVVCLIEDQDKRRIIREFLVEETRPLLSSQVDEAYRDAFNALDNLSSVESSRFFGDKGLALSWFLGGDDWFTDTEMTLKDLSHAGVSRAAAALSLDGQIHHLFKVDDKSNVALINDCDEESLLLNSTEEPGFYEFMFNLLRP